MWIVGAYIKVVEPAKNPSSHMSGGGIAAMFFFYLWTVFYTPTWNGTPWVLNSVSPCTCTSSKPNQETNSMEQEMFDPNMRSLAQACAAASNWLWNFLISRFTPQMFAKMGYGVFFFFASLMILSTVFVFFLVPETKGVPLESMDQLFEIKPVWKAHSQIVERLREEEERFRHDIEESGVAANKIGDTQVEDASKAEYA